MPETLRKDYQLVLDYSAPLGEVYSAFMEGLKNQRILSNKCSHCARQYVPPRPFCDVCCEMNGEAAETEPLGKVVSFTVYTIKTRNLPDPPFVQALIKIGDSANSFLHYLGDVKFKDLDDLRSKVKIGMKVKPVWADERTGSILDIKHFAPA